MGIAAEIDLEPSVALEDDEQFVTTKSGRLVLARPLERADAPLLVDLFSRLSERTRWLRFSKPRGSAELAWREATRLARCGAPADTNLIGVVHEDGEERAIALIQIVRVAATVAEVAAVVRDDYQNDGVGKAICQLAAQLAMSRGIKTLQILTQAENRKVHQLVRGTGAAYSAEIQNGELTLLVQLSG